MEADLVLFGMLKITSVRKNKRIARSPVSSISLRIVSNVLTILPRVLNKMSKKIIQ